MKKETISEVELLDKYFRLANYMSVGKLYLKDNPLLKRELSEEDMHEYQEYYDGELDQTYVG